MEILHVLYRATWLGQQPAWPSRGRSAGIAEHRRPRPADATSTGSVAAGVGGHDTALPGGVGADQLREMTRGRRGSCHAWPSLPGRGQLGCGNGEQARNSSTAQVLSDFATGLGKEAK